MKETQIDSLVNTVCFVLKNNDDVFKNKLSLTLHYLCSINEDYKEKMVFNYIFQFAEYYYKYYKLTNDLNIYSEELINLSTKKDVKPNEMEDILNKCTKTEDELKNEFMIPFHESVEILFEQSIKDVLENKNEFLNASGDETELTTEMAEDVIEEDKEEEEEVKESINSFATNPNIFEVSEEFKKIDFSFIDKQEERLRIEKQKADIVEEIQLHQEILKSLEEDYVKNSNAIVELYNKYKELDNYGK